MKDILAGHVSLDVACLDRIYLNGYVCPERGRGWLDVGRAFGLGAVRAMEVGPPEPPSGRSSSGLRQRSAPTTQIFLQRSRSRSSRNVHTS